MRIDGISATSNGTTKLRAKREIQMSTILNFDDSMPVFQFGRIAAYIASPVGRRALREALEDAARVRAEQPVVSAYTGRAARFQGKK